uniref:Retrovirus-related Pol polyprotein from transposon TNT 1-94 n=1 Tax=Anopheles funestus TaxID=62324 RepID=A0A4Y0BLU3_ANOFN
MESFRVAVSKLTNDNYQTWRYKIEMLLKKEELWYVISEPKPENPSTEWMKHDMKANATIGLHVDDDQIGLIRECATAQDSWKTLKTYHEKASEIYLLKKLTLLQLGEEGNMEEHVRKFSELLQRIAGSSEPIPKKWQVAMLLCSLPPSYDPLVTALEQKPLDELSLEFVKSKLLGEFEKRKERVAASSSESGMALNTVWKKQKQNGREADVRKCFHCNKPGHFKKDCRLLQKLKNEPKQTEKAKSVTNYSEPVAFIVGRGERKEWFMDSGATKHMTSCKEFFEKFESTNGSDVLIADGKRVEVAGFGSGRINCLAENGELRAIEISEVLYVPSLTTGLISVSVLTKKGFNVEFTESKCIVKDVNGKRIADATAVGNLYKLNTYEYALQTKCCEHTWHRRMGHRDIQTIKKIFNDGVMKSKIGKCKKELPCRCCLKAKMSRTPFPKVSEGKTQNSLELIHTDLSGPLESTPSGNKYYMTFIDDFTRMTFVYLLQSKSDAATKIREFVSFCATQFGKVPKVMRSDGGGEYISHDLQTFLRQKGIVNQFSSPYSPQQNGIAERKNRYLKEMAMCMLEDAQLERRFWGEAILTATYIQNRIPTRATGMSPYEKWYLRKPSYDHFRIFGSEAYVYIPDEKRKKMEPRSKRLTFIGYSLQHKAYRFVDRATNKITISRDAKFIEQVEHNIDIFAKGNEIEDIAGETDHDSDDVLSKDSFKTISDESKDSEDSICSDHAQEDGKLTKRKTRGKLPQRYNDYEMSFSAVCQYPNSQSFDEADFLFREGQMVEGH